MAFLLFEKMLFYLCVMMFKALSPAQLKNEFFAGLTVAMTMIPESLSFAILAGLNPLMGLYAAVIMGLVTAIFGGRPGMVSGGAGATVITLIALISSHGVEYLLATVVLGGLLQIIVGVFKWGKFVRLIPQSVMYGFLNGLAVVIFMSQVSQFKLGTTNEWMTGTSLWTMLGLTLLTVIVVYIFPKITKQIPASLVGIMVVFGLVYFLQIDTKKVVDIASISGSLPSFHIPMVPLTMETLSIIFPYALVMAGVGLIETLLTLSIVDEVTNTKGVANKEAVAQGSANILNGFFGGMGGCAMIAQTMVNLEAGSRLRLSAIIGSLTILLIILVGAPVIEQIPIAALVGVMMVVAVTTFHWGFFKIIRKMPKADIIVTIIVAGITIFLHNLALAVLVGVIISALVFAWDSAVKIRARQSMDEQGRKVYELLGPLFFGSIANFLEKFDFVNDPQEIVIDFKESRIADMSAIEALNKISAKYTELGKTVTLKHVSPDSQQLLANAECKIEISESDPSYRVMPK